jgi:hypothetical protein
MRYGYWLPVFGGWLRSVARRVATELVQAHAV